MSDTEKKETATEDKAKKATKKVTKKVAPSEEKKATKKTESKAAPKTKAKPKSSTISVTLKRSAIGRPEEQKATLVGLGFKRLNQTVVLKDTPQTRGMINKVSHLVTVE